LALQRWLGLLPKLGSGLAASDYYCFNRRQENLTLAKTMNYRLVATMDSQSRHLRLAVEHPGPQFVFFVIERDESDIIKQVLETGTADTVEQALGKVEEVAKEYLSRDGEQATVPFWILEDA
jgi:hypothetical protein